MNVHDGPDGRPPGLAGPRWTRQISGRLPVDGSRSMFARKRPFLMMVAVALAACSGDDAGDGEAEAGRGSAGRGDEGEGGAATGGSRGGSGGASTGTDTDAGASDAGGAGASGEGARGECDPSAQEHEHDSMPAMHVPVPLAASTYNSSPPSSGPHCPAWGRYAVYGEDAPLPACNFLHNLEHGAIVLLYNCPDGCDEIVADLEQVIADAPEDPECGVVKRLLLTPYAEMEATIAAAAWGYTWTADCLDDGARESLLDFIAAHRGPAGDAPESVCGDGSIGP
jgi:Protein of unknown function (DUF3105)